MSDVEAPEAVVRRQVDAFNAHALDAFLATYSPTARVTGVAASPLIGQAALRSFYAERLSDASVHCTLEAVVVLEGRWVVALEKVSSTGGYAEVCAIFDVVDGHIERLSLLTN